MSTRAARASQSQTASKTASLMEDARPRTITLTPNEQLAFWQALEQPVSLTPRQRELGRIMRGER